MVDASFGGTCEHIDLKDDRADYYSLLFTTVSAGCLQESWEREKLGLTASSVGHLAKRPSVPVVFKNGEKRYREMVP